MAHWTEDLHDLGEKITDEIAKANKKLEKSGGELSAGDIEYIDKLTHALKSIKTTLAMEEYEDDYSNMYGGNSYARGGNRGGGRSSNRSGNSYEGGNSYARGRRGNVRRDSMGRYSRDGYSYDDAMDEMASSIREGMHDMPEELKRDAQRFLKKLEQEM